jgi:hypothetical protein
MTGPMTKSATQRRERIVSIAFLAIAVAFVGLYSLSVWRQATARIETDATITDRVEYRKRIKLTVDFTASDGRSVRTTFLEYSNP